MLQQQQKQQKQHQESSDRDADRSEQKANKSTNRKQDNKQQLLQFDEQFQNKYKEYFNDTIGISRQEIQRMLVNDGSFQIQGWYQDCVDITIVNTNLQSVTLKIRYGYYSTKIHILNVQLQFIQNQEKVLGIGAFGSVYKVSFSNQNYALKIINFTLQDKQQSTYQAYKQYFLLKIASVLQFGPKVMSVYGYDLIIFSDCIAFSMQLCHNLSPSDPIMNTSQLKLRNEKKLKQSLKTMHNMKLCHCDIKPTNIAWSHCFKKLVFLDFGLSRFANYDPGFKEKIGFIGNYMYCSDEMKKSSWLNSRNYVDLYNNDVVGLEKSIKFIKIAQKISDQNRNDYRQYEIECKRRTDRKNSLKQKFYKDENSFLDKSVLIFRIKFYFYIEETVLATQILFLLINEQKMQKTVFQLLYNKQITYKIAKNWALRNEKEKMLKKLQNNKNRVDKIDQMISNYQQQVNSGQFQAQLNQLEYILSLKRQSFNRLLQLEHWMIKLYFLIDCNLNNTPNFYAKVGSDYKYKIIQKIYLCNSQPENTQNQSSTELEKVRVVLLLFYQYFERQKNIPILQRIWVIFRQVGDYSVCQQISAKICEHEKDPIVRSLHVLYFYFYPLLSNVTFNCNYNIGIIKKCQQFLEEECKKCHQQKTAATIIEINKFIKMYIQKVEKSRCFLKYEQLQQQLNNLCFILRGTAYETKMKSIKQVCYLALKRYQFEYQQLIWHMHKYRIPESIKIGELPINGLKKQFNVKTLRSMLKNERVRCMTMDYWKNFLHYISYVEFYFPNANLFSCSRAMFYQSYSFYVILNLLVSMNKKQVIYVCYMYIKLFKNKCEMIKPQFWKMMINSKAFLGTQKISLCLSCIQFYMEQIIQQSNKTAEKLFQSFLFLNINLINLSFKQNTKNILLAIEQINYSHKINQCRLVLDKYMQQLIQQNKKQNKEDYLLQSCQILSRIMELIIKYKNCQQINKNQIVLFVDAEILPFLQDTFGNLYAYTHVSYSFLIFLFVLYQNNKIQYNQYINQMITMLIQRIVLNRISELLLYRQLADKILHFNHQHKLHQLNHKISINMLLHLNYKYERIYRNSDLGAVYCFVEKFIQNLDHAYLLALVQRYCDAGCYSQVFVQQNYHLSYLIFLILSKFQKNTRNQEMEAQVRRKKRLLVLILYTLSRIKWEQMNNIKSQLYLLHASIFTDKYNSDRKRYIAQKIRLKLSANSKQKTSTKIKNSIFNREYIKFTKKCRIWQVRESFNSTISKLKLFYT